MKLQDIEKETALAETQIESKIREANREKEELAS